MKKRILALVLVLTILFSNDLTSLAYYRTSMFKQNVTDMVEWDLHEVYELGTQEKAAFSYEVPEEGATVLIFFSPTCMNSQNFFKDLNQCPWVDSEYLNIVAVEGREDTGRQETIEFLNSCFPNYKDDINVFYDNTQLQFSYLDMVTDTEEWITISWPYVLVITETGENRVIRYAKEGILSAEGLYQALCSVSSRFAQSEPVFSENKENPKISDEVLVAVAGRDFQCQQWTDGETLSDADILLNMIKSYRVENGCSELEMDQSITNLAEIRTHELAVDYSTIRPNEESWNDMGFDLGTGVIDAEFIAIGMSDPETVLENWMSDEAHRNYLLNTKAKNIGVSCFQTPNTTIWVVLFGEAEEYSSVFAHQISSYHLVQTDPDKLKPVKENYDITLGLEEAGSFEVEYRNQGADFAPSVLIPEIKDVYDENGNLIARLSVNVSDDGRIQITPVNVGSGSIELPVYDGQKDPVVLNLTVNESGNEQGNSSFYEASGEEHSISVISTGKGNAYAELNSAAAGQEVLVTMIPNEGCEFYRCVVITGEEGNQDLYASFDLPNDYLEQVNKYTCKFTMPDTCVSIEIIFTESFWETEGFVPENHYHEYELVDFQMPVCLKKGYTGDWVCTECEEIIVEGMTMPAKEHTLINETLIQASTCQNEGIIQYACEDCDAEFTTNIGVLGAGFPGELNNPFVDVKTGSYYFNSVLWAVGRNITSGTSATTFTPNGTCTRAQIVTFLWRAQGSPEPETAECPFTDVPAGSYYEKAVLWAVEQGITSGMTKMTFGPDEPCTRAHVVTFLHRWQGEPESTLTEHAFTDVKQGDYYYEAMLWAVEEEITVGMTATTFGPKNPCTRAQIVTFLRRAMVE